MDRLEAPAKRFETQPPRPPELSSCPGLMILSAATILQATLVLCRRFGVPGTVPRGGGATNAQSRFPPGTDRSPSRRLEGPFPLTRDTSRSHRRPDPTGSGSHTKKIVPTAGSTKRYTRRASPPPRRTKAGYPDPSAFPRSLPLATRSPHAANNVAWTVFDFLFLGVSAFIPCVN